MTESAQLKPLQERIAAEEGRRKRADEGLGVQLGTEEGKRASGEAAFNARLAAVEAKPTPEPEPPPTPEGTLLFRADRWEDFAYRYFVPGGIENVTDPLGSGEATMKFSLRDGDEPIQSGNPRAQLETPKFIAPGLDFWFTADLLIPTDYPVKVGSSPWMTLLSVYGEPFGGSGPWHIESYPGKLSWDQGWEATLEQGKWLRILQHGVFTDHGPLELWLNGKQQTFSNGKTVSTAPLRKAGVNDGANNNLRIAQYCKKGSLGAQTGTIYWKRVRAGTTRASVGG